MCSHASRGFQSNCREKIKNKVKIKHQLSKTVNIQGHSPSSGTGFQASLKDCTWLLKDTHLWSSKRNCSRPVPEPECVSRHVGFTESTKRAKEDKACEEDRGWTGLRMQGQSVRVLLTMGTSADY